MRLGFALFAYAGYWQIFRQFDTKNIVFYVALTNLLFGLLLLIGGFMKKPALTIVSGLLIFLAAGYQVYLSLPGGFNVGFATYIIIGSIGLYFFAHGNQ